MDKNKIKKLLNGIAIITSGSLVSSLFFSNTDLWKYYLSVCLICIISVQTLDNE